jgi:heptosyltransferase I
MDGAKLNQNYKLDFLMIRMDRIGDLVLTLPVDQCELLKDKKIHWVINKGMGFIPIHAEPKRDFTEFPLKFSWTHLKQLMQLIKSLDPQNVVVFYAPWWVSLATWLSRIPTRIGRLSQWHSFLFYNFGIRQSRSEAIYHEYTYNLRLLQRGLLRAKVTKSLPVSIEEKDKNYLKLKHSDPETVLKLNKLSSKDYIVIHPGMRSSALNWPYSHSIQLIKKLLKNHKVVITGTKDDKNYLSPIQLALDEHKNLYWLNEKLNTSELIAVLSQAKAVVAPSTGVIHLAASSLVPSIGIYSPIKVESPTRWAPRGPKVAALTPPLMDDDDSEVPKDIMSQLNVTTVYKQVESFINANP